MFGYSYIAYLLPLEANGKPSKKDFISLPTFSALSWVKTACGPTSILTCFQFWSESEIVLISKFGKQIGKSTQLEILKILGSGYKCRYAPFCPKLDWMTKVNRGRMKAMV